MNEKLKLMWKPLVSVTLWGASFIASKFLLEYLSPLSIIWGRLVLAVMFLLVIVILRKRSFAMKLNDFKWLVILALVASFHLWIQVTGLKFTSASNTGWIIGFSPVFMTILGVIFFKEKLSLLRISGIIIAFAGVLLLISKGNFRDFNFLQHKGDLLIFASAFTWSVYSLITKKVTLNYAPMMTILYLFFFMAIILSPFTINQTNIDAVTHLSLNGWTALLFLGFFSSGVAYVFWASAMSEMDSSKVGAFLYIEPFVTLFTAWIVLNENITVVTVISGIIIIGGVVMVNYE